MLMRNFTRRCGLALALAVSFSMQAAAQAPTQIRMIGFGGATNLPAWVAQDKGFFAKEGLVVTLDKTAGSQEQMADVMNGKYEFVTTAFDNIVAYTDGQGALKFDNYDLTAILGVHSGLNSVVARPEIKTYADLKGKVLAVDAVASGYATVLYEILKRKGLTDKDYTLIAVGATDGRMAALEDGRAHVAIISSPQDIQLQKKGFTILDDVAVALGDSQGSVYAVRKSWAKDHEKEVLALMRAVVAAQNYVFDNKDGAVEVLMKRTPGLAKADAEEIWKRLTGPGGLTRNAALNAKGVQSVLDLRRVYGNPAKGEGSRYIDLSWAEKLKK
jgi:ABC-type nitrate/sulfonate/bicarbonate transport system substrate-binding protein